jgi:hypothetical protein
MAALTSSALTCAVVAAPSVSHIAPAANGLAGNAQTKGFAKQGLSLKAAVQKQTGRSKSHVTMVAGDVSAEGTQYLIIGAIAIAVVGSAFPLFFARKDTCPDCDGAGFVRAGTGGAALNANAARKDQGQIVCKRCNGLGKLNQVDK